MINMPTTQTTYFPLQGGLNLVTPPLSMPDGMCREALNFEVDIDGGYRRVAGYERYDGQSAPSDALYFIAECTFSGTVNVGDTITGLTSGATAVVIAVTAEYIAFTKLTGEFDLGEDIQVSAVTVATTTSASVEGGAPTQPLNADYYNLAADLYRADILPVTGSGPILGVHRYNNKVYAFRNNVGGTAAYMHVESPTGWQLVDLGYEIAFTNANTSVNDLDTLTQGGVTSTVKRVVVETGSLLSGTNTGRLIISAPSGGSFAAGVATTSGAGSLTLSGAETAITLAPNGRYEFANHNFGGLSSGTKMYGASGTHRAFEFDGAIFVPISTGMVTDTPLHIIAHNNHLMLSFDGSIQHSATGDPYSYTIISGAGELAMGDTVTGMLSLVGTNQTASLAIFTTNKTAILYGTGSSDWQLVTYSFESGGFDYTMQNIGQGYVLDAFGVTQLATSQNFGNFASTQVTNLIRPFILERTTKSVGSCIVRLRNQYRVLFNDTYALYFTFNNAQVTGIMPVQYAHTMTCLTSYESNSGDEWVLAGDTNGYVYRMEKGSSFDGENITAYMNLSFSYMKTPRTRKRFRKVIYELSGLGYAEFTMSYNLGYISNEIDQGNDYSVVKGGSYNYWDTFTWDNAYWDGQAIYPIEQDITGVAENISLIISCDSDLYEPFTVNSAIINYTTRRNLR